MSSINLDVSCINELNKNQKVAFLRAFVKMAHVDGHFDESERDFILTIARDLNLSAESIKHIFDPSNEDDILANLSEIKDRYIAMEIIKELCLLAHSDDELSNEETLFLGRAGQAMGVELEKIEEISAWVVDYIIWKEQGKIIFEEV